MPLTYKINVIEALKQRGFSSYRIRTDHILSESTVTKLRNGNGVSWDNLETICRLLNCQPGDLLEYVPDNE